MQANRFDEWTRRLTRRGVLAGASVAALAGVRVTRAAAFDCAGAAAAMQGGTCDPDACFAAGGCCDPFFGCCAQGQADPFCSGPVTGLCGDGVDGPCTLGIVPSDDPRICVHRCFDCPAGWAVCSSPFCQRLTSDPANCGACGNACPAGQACTDGVCGASSGCDGCGPRERCKNGRCIKRRKHRRH